MTAAPDDLLTQPPAAQADPEAEDCAGPDPSLQLDVAMVLVQCHRDRSGDGIFRPDVSQRRLEEFAAVVARSLGRRIGGRYIPKRTPRDSIAERDAAVVAALGKGATTRQVMRDFRISRRLLYAILARTRPCAA